MSSISITFSNPHLFFLLIPAFAVIIIPFFLISKVRRRTFRKIMPVILHCLIAILIVMIAAGTRIVTKTSEEATALLLDLSDSTFSVRDKLLSDAGSLEEIIRTNSPASVVMFADNKVAAGSTANITSLLESPDFSVDATNLADAIEYTVSLLPKNKPRRIIVFSDGRETDGNAAKTAEFYANLGVQIDTVYYNTSEVTAPEVQANSVIGTKSIFLGDEVHFSLEVETNVANTVRIVVSDGGRGVSGYSYDLTPGTQVIDFTDTPKVAGLHTYTFNILSNLDTNRDNNYAMTTVDVTGTSNILIIADKRPTASRLKVLLEGDNAVTFVTVDDVPKTFPELAEYDEVILANVDYNTLPEGYGKMLQKYVYDFGRTLLTVGGTNTYMLGNMEGTELEEMLPVSFGLTEDETDRAVALMLVIDASRSMSMNNSPNMSMAKQGAINCLEAMSSADYVGVISFNRNAAVRSKLVAANDDNKQYLTRVISGLNTASGTYYTEALELAHRELKNSSAPVKHVMFLSDGQPNDRDYLDVVSQMAEDGITVSTIGLGYTSAQLRAMANSGNGRYYYVPNATNLPEIMLSEAQQVTIDSLRLGSYRAVINGHDPLTEDIVEEDIPALSGYVATKLKDEALAPLLTDEGYPLFVKHTYGNGTVATFTSDLSGDWSSKWISDGTGNELIERFISTTLPEEHLESSLDVTYELFGKTAKITIRPDTLLEGAKLLISSVDDNSSEYEPEKVSEGVYEATVHVIPDKVNHFTVTVNDSNAEPVDFTNLYIPVAFSPEYKLFGDSGETALAAVSRPSGGKALSAASDTLTALAAMTGRSIEYVTDLLIPFAIIALVLLLLDIIIRKLRWKDIARFFRKGK